MEKKKYPGKSTEKTERRRLMTGKLDSFHRLGLILIPHQRLVVPLSHLSRWPGVCGNMHELKPLIWSGEMIHFIVGGNRVRAQPFSEGENISFEWVIGSFSEWGRATVSYWVICWCAAQPHSLIAGRENRSWVETKKPALLLFPQCQSICTVITAVAQWQHAIVRLARTIRP